MKPYIITTSFVIMISYSIFSQTKIWNNWYFGEKAGLSFNTEPPKVLTDGKLSTREGCASISDNTGNLLFYTNGVTVWDRNHNVMPNGTGLLGHISSSQSAIILPKPNSNNIYYIFTTSASENVFLRSLCYSVVDMQLNGGMGDIIASKKNILVHNNSSEGLSATIHSNGTDYWIISHFYNGSIFYCNLLSETGVNTKSVISNFLHYYDVTYYISIKVSSYSDKIVTVTNMGTVALFDFDNSTGKVSINNIYNMPGSAFDAEFSPDNTKLYTASTKGTPFNWKTKLYQFDLSESSFTPKKITDINGYKGSSLQLASNGKIYVVCNNYHYGLHVLSVINNPNQKGNNCDFKFDAISLTPGKSKSSLPNCIFISQKYKANAGTSATVTHQPNKIRHTHTQHQEHTQ